MSGKQTFLRDYQSEVEVCQDALHIYEGACNGKAIARTLTAIYGFVSREGGTNKSNQHPAVTLILYQLAYLNNFIFLPQGRQEDVVDAAVKYCNSIVDKAA